MTVRYPIEILGTGMYVPETIRDNKHFVDYLDTSEEWIVTRTGIRERRVAAPEQATSDLAAEASRRALEDAQLEPDDIDAIICATATGDHQFPATAAFVQAGLGCRRQIPAFDVSAACAGFLHAATLAAPMLGSGMYDKVLVIGRRP